MKVSINTVKQYIDVDVPSIDILVDKINRQLGGVEEVINLGEKYKDAQIVRVVECEKHPNADKLSVCRIDAGQDTLIDVVCGAPNVKADMWAIWLPPGSTVPSTYEDAEPFVLGSRELRGIMSNGMLASARELGIGEDHDGIVEVTETDLPAERKLTPGGSFAVTFGMNDTIIDIENKMFTHRPDLFGQLGVAREISAILQGSSDESLKVEDTRYQNPEWYWTTPEFNTGNNSVQLEVFNDTPSNAPRFMAVAIDGIKVGPSPLWLKCELVRWGSKPINNIVDLTNYIMLLTAQPTHAYDYDKLRGSKLGVRMANDGEKVTLLNGKKYELAPEDIVIADGEGAVGLAGIMGGGDSEVSQDTTRVVLEIANFDMYAVRKSSMRHGLFTDALTRFNKGQSSLQASRITKRLIDMIPGNQASPVHDLPGFSDGLNRISVHPEVSVTPDFINQRLGLELSANQISSLLRRVNFAVHLNEDDSNALNVTAPFWRTDIELPEDVVEEVGRLYGFDKLPRELPIRSTKPTPRNASVVAKQAIRDGLSRAGANEVLTYSFINKQVIEKSGQDASQAFSLSNALSPDLQYYRLSLTPSLLDKVHPNIKSGYDEFGLYEIGTTHHANSFDETGLPKQFDRVAFVYASRKESDGSPYYKAKTIAGNLLDNLNLVDQLSFRKLSEFDFGDWDALRQMCTPFDEHRSAMIYSGDTLLGVVGEYKTVVSRNFKLPDSVSGFELFISPLIGERMVKYRPLSKFPSTHQDISLRVDAHQTYSVVVDEVWAAVMQAKPELKVELQPLSIYQADDSSSKTITLRLTFNNPTATLTDAEVNAVMESVAERANQSLGAERI